MIDPGEVDFACTRCARCCKKPGWVQFGPEEERRAARLLSVSVEQFRSRFATARDEEGTWIRVTRSRPCPFLSKGLCEINEAKPEQCKSFPYWRENLRSQRAWNRLARSCPGAKPIGHVHRLDQENGLTRMHSYSSRRPRA